MTGKDPLQDLLLNAEEVDRARLAQGLQGILGVDRSSGRLVLKPGFNSLDTGRKVIAYLLGSLAASLLAARESETVSPSEVQRETGLPKGTVNPKLSSLYKARLVSKTKDGAYYVAPHQVMGAIQMIHGREVRDEEISDE